VQAGEMTILISSHELSEIEGVVTHVGFIDEGKLLLAESMSDLAARFREVRVVLEESRGGVAVQAKAPEHWLGLQTTGNVLTFVDTHFSESGFGEELAAFVGGVRRMRSRWRCDRYLRRWRGLAGRKRYDLAHF